MAKHILVTGANRGIGLCIVQALATRFPSDVFIMAARNAGSLPAAISTLREKGVTADLEQLELDVSSDLSVVAATEAVKTRFGKLDVLVNNAGIAKIPASDASLAEHRSAWASVIDTNVASVANVTSSFLPLLRTTTVPVVVNISSGRASITRSITGGLPPTASVAYSVSKIALNGLTVEMMKKDPSVRFYCANPGHCKTEFNGFKGQREPLEGANVVVALVEAAGSAESGFWETKGDSMKLEMVPW